MLHIGPKLLFDGTAQLSVEKTADGGCLTIRVRVDSGSPIPLQDAFRKFLSDLGQAGREELLEMAEAIG